MANTTETLRQIIKVDGIDKASKDINQLKGNIDNSNQSLISMGLRFVSVGLAVKTLTDSYKAFIVQRDAVNRVELAINNMGLQSSITAEAVQDIASELQSLTNYGDEETLGKIFQPLILAGVDSVDAMKSIGMTILDVADGTGMGIESVSTQITGLISGASDRVTELARATRISQEAIKKALEGANTATERAIALQDVLSGKFQGTAEKSVDPLKQLENTIGDVKEELGKAFYPLIKTLAESAKSFLENEDNVKSLITTVNVLTASFAGLQAIKFGGNLVNQFKNVDRELGNLNVSAKEMSSAIEGSKIAKNFKNLNQELYVSGQRVKSIKPLFDSTTKSVELFKVSLNFGKAALSLLGWVGVAYSAITIVNRLGKSFGIWGQEVEDVTSKLEEQKKVELGRRQVFKDSLQTAKDLLSINNRTVAENKNLSKTLNDLKSGYGITIGLEEDRAIALRKINDELETQKSFNSAEGVTTNLKKDIADTEALLAKSTKMMEHWGSFKLYETTFLDKVQAWFGGYSAGGNLSQQGQWFKDEEKLVSEYTLKLEELKNQLELLNNTSGGSDSELPAEYYNMVKFADSNYYSWKKTQIEKSTDEYLNSLDKSLYEEEEILKMRTNMNAKQIEDLDKQRDDYYNSQQAVLTKSLSALSTYYEMVKFTDEGYYDWRIKTNKEESDRYIQQLVDSGYTLLEAQEEGKKLEIELNKKTNQEKLNWETLYQTTVQNLSKSTHQQALDSIAREVNAMEALTDAEKQHLIILKQKQYIQEQQKSALASYYDTVGKLDKNHFDYKKQLIEDDIKTQLEAGLINQDQADLLREKRMEDLLMETEAWQNYYSIVNAGIQGAMGSMLEFAKITAKSNNDIAKAWYALANAIIAELKRIVVQMMVNFVWQKILGFLNFGSIAKALPLGIGEGLPMGGNIASIGTSPNTGIGANIPQTPIVNLNRGNDISIVDRLERLENSIVDAINNNSLRTQIRTIDRIELAQEVEAGNLQRSVK